MHSPLRRLWLQAALARHLLASAGFPGGHGLPPMTYTVDEDAQSLVLASALAAQWSRVLGVTLHLAQEDHTDYDNLLQARAFQIAVIDWTADYPDPHNFLSQQLRSGASNNNSGWSNATFDRLVDRADGMAADDPLRQALYCRAENLAVSQAPWIPLTNPRPGVLLRQSVRGLRVSGGDILAADWTRVTVAAGGGR